MLMLAWWYFKASTFHWLLCLHQSLIILCQPWHTVALAPSARRPGLCLLGFGAGSDAHSPWQHLPGIRAASSLTSPRRHLWLGLEAAKLSPVVVPGAALVASTPLLAKRSSLPPPWSYKFLSRAVPDSPFHLSATSWHPPAPSSLGTRPLCLLVPWAIQRGPTRGRMLWRHLGTLCFTHCVDTATVVA